jgi:DNA-3-methyladenine glycosylase II
MKHKSVHDNKLMANQTVIRQHADVLSQRHPAFNRLIETIGDTNFDIPAWHHIDDAIVYAIIGQMLSNAASSAIIGRLKQRFTNSGKVIRWASKTAGKKGPLHGVSQRKRKALRAWLEFSKSNNRAWQKWPLMPLEKYQNEITGIWGFGRWSADMIAIFYLARMDIWPETDAGINRVISTVFSHKSGVNMREYVKGCETVAALYLWELLNRNLLGKFEYEIKRQIT